MDEQEYEESTDPLVLMFKQFDDESGESSDEFLRFERVKNKRSNRPDLHAFLLLDELQPSAKSRDIVSAAEHDQIWLGIDTGKLAEVITSEQVLELIRCGVIIDEHDDGGLFMFA
jgi:hypothetical protein